MMSSDKATFEIPSADLEELTDGFRRVEDLSRRLVSVLTTKTTHNPALDGPDQSLFAEGIAAYWTQAIQNPIGLMEKQAEYWGNSALNLANAQRAALLGEPLDGSASNVQDRRFANPFWDENPVFNFIKQQYLTNAAAIEDAIGSVEDLDAKEKQRLSHFTHQIVDMMAPTNFLLTNPDALQKAIETGGESLVQGLENLVTDLEANNGELLVRLADESAFEIGGNVAATPGDVVFRNRMMELIQYRPTTETVHETPVILFPPWINKFYILDLKEKNSMIKWITDQGYTLFVVSWVNPDASFSDVGLDDYIEEGYLTAIDVTKEICGVDQVNAVGYCIAGTTLSLTLSLLKQKGDTSVKSATFFTTLTDFSDQGEFTPFLQDDFIDAIEDEVSEQGLLRAFIMARTFSFLRPNDLVYGPAIKSYLMGETPPAFDLLFWNGDGANLPARMAVQYLRGLCQSNKFVEDGFDILDHRLSINDVDVPLMAITCETDHIAAWKDCYRGVQKMGSKDRTFVVSESGHIAGIVNPPTKNKYGHYTNADLSLYADDWLDKAKFHEGSWWPLWGMWLDKHSGGQVPARTTGNAKYPPLCDAPGTYVKARARAL